MIRNYSTSKRKATNESDNVSKTEVGPPEPKMSKKRTSLPQFSKEETPNIIKSMDKYKPSGDWRKITEIKTNYTYITKNWWYNDELLCKEKHIILFGMLKTFEKLISHSKCYQ